jgi:hypothetical protein
MEKIILGLNSKITITIYNKMHGIYRKHSIIKMINWSNNSKLHGIKLEKEYVKIYKTNK